MAAALAQYMANQGQTVSDSDVNALAMAIANTIMPRGATFLDTGADANTYVWQNGVYSCTENVANMPVPGHTWIVNAEVIDSNDVCLNAYDLTTPGSLYIRQKSAGAWSAWFTPAPANATSTTPGLVEIAASPASGAPVASSRVASASEVQITGTTAQTIASFTPTTQGNFEVRVYFRVVTGTTSVTATITYADTGGAQTLTLLNAQSCAIGSYTTVPAFINATSASAITVQMTASVANHVYASGGITGV